MTGRAAPGDRARPGGRRAQSSRSTRSCTRARQTCPRVLEQVRAVDRGQGRRDRRAAPRGRRRATAPGCWPARRRWPPGSRPAGGCWPSATAAAPPTRSSSPRCSCTPAATRAGRCPRSAWPATPSVLTALSNDIGVEVVFARQLAAFGGQDDIAVGLSTSGNSDNLLRAFDEASRRGHADHRHRRLRRRQDGRAGQHRLPVRRAVLVGAPDPGGPDHDLPRRCGSCARPSCGVELATAGQAASDERAP